MNSKLKISIFSILVALFTISCTSSGKSNSEQAKENEPVYQLDETFLKDYMGNRVGADNKYKNKTFRVKGTIMQFSNFGGPTVHVYVPEVDGTALCHFDESMSEEVGLLQGGSTVVIEGVFSSMIASVDFQQCKIIEVIPAENIQQ